ncbi:MAG: AMP-binding protein [Candidatus Rokubacteria bacterium]|nr:AMP-binding protein [Candidatus Rokubacteria bacterium]
MAIETIVTPELISRYTQAGFWGQRIWTDYIDATSERASSRLALVDSAGRLTYSELRRAIDRLALHLLDLGIKKEDRFGLQLPNWREFVLMRFALAKIGAVAVPLPADWRRKEVEYVLGATEATGVLIPAGFRGREYVPEYEEVARALPALRTRLVTRADGGLPAGWRALADLLDDPIEARCPRDLLRSLRPGPNEVDLIVTTSGSTAAPKLVVRTPNCFLTTTRQFVEHRGLLTERDVVAGLAPVARGVGYWIGVAAPVVAGCAMALLEQFTPEAALQWIAQTRATVAIAVPAQIIKMLQVPDLERYDLSSLRLFVNGGAAIPPSAAEEIERRLGCTTMSARTARSRAASRPARRSTTPPRSGFGRSDDCSREWNCASSTTRGARCRPGRRAKSPTVDRICPWAFGEPRTPTGNCSTPRGGSGAATSASSMRRGT